MFHVKHSPTGRGRLGKRPPEQTSAAQGERRKTHSRSRDPPCVSCETSEWGMRPHPPPPRASVRNPHAPAPARRSTQSGRSSASACEPEPLADDLPARTRICPRSYREPRRRPLSARPRLSEGGPSTRSHACPQSRREPARPAQGSRAPASAVRKRLTHPRTPPSPGRRPTARTPRPPSACLRPR